MSGFMRRPANHHMYDSDWQQEQHKLSTDSQSYSKNKTRMYPQRLAMLDDSVNLATNEHFKIHGSPQSSQVHHLPSESYGRSNFSTGIQTRAKPSVAVPSAINSSTASFDELIKENMALKTRNEQLENEFEIISEAYLAIEAKLDVAVDEKVTAEERNERHHLSTMAFAKDNRKANARICFLQEKLDTKRRLTKENERLRGELMMANERLRTKQMLIDQQTYILEGGEELMEDAVW